MVEFASRDGISSLHGAASLPNIQHEASVPFKSRLLTLKSNGVDLSDGPTSLKLQPQTSLSVNELIQRLAKEESVSMPQGSHGGGLGGIFNMEDVTRFKEWG